MKKIVLFVLLICFAFLFACNTSNKEKEEPDINDKPNYEEILKKAVNALTLPTEVTENIKLETSITSDEYTIVLLWESNNSAITNTGVVTRGDEDIECKLIVHGKLDTFTFDKSFDIKVLKEEKASSDELFELAYQEIVKQIPDEVTNDLTLATSISISNNDFVITYNFEQDVISSDGKLYPYEETDVEIGATLVLKLVTTGEEKTYSKENIKVPSMKTLCDRVSNQINIPNEVNDDLELITNSGIVIIEWSSNKTKALTSAGKCLFVSSDIEAKLRATIYIEIKDRSYFLDKEYKVTVKPWSAEKRFNLVKDSIVIPGETNEDIIFKTSFEYNVLCKWESSNDEVITSIGRVYPKQSDETVVITAVLYTLDSEDELRIPFVVNVLKEEVVDGEINFRDHNLIVRANEFEPKNLNGLVYDEASGRIKLASGANSGTYESLIYKIHDSYEIVGSYSCITSLDATCEVQYALRVNGTWSKYFTYGEWGLGRQNYYYNQSDSLVSMSVDEINVKDNKTANAVKFKVILKRTNNTTDSPALAMVACCLFINNYTYAVDTSKILKSKDWDVPKLYQHDVPSIGGVICSPTTTTMLLKFMGYSFTDKGYKYEHEYIARMVADPGHNSPTYGNWSYNMIGAGAFGASAYVARIYSFEELQYHLCTVGPVGASIKGYFGSYTTGGHLIVVRGYRVEENQTIVICNDPNVRGVYYEVTLDIFMNAWRNMAYIFEYDRV